MDCLNLNQTLIFPNVTDGNPCNTADNTSLLAANNTADNTSLLSFNNKTAITTLLAAENTTDNTTGNTTGNTTSLAVDNATDIMTLLAAENTTDNTTGNTTGNTTSLAVDNATGNTTLLAANSTTGNTTSLAVDNTTDIMTLLVADSTTGNTTSLVVDNATDIMALLTNENTTSIMTLLTDSHSEDALNGFGRLNIHEWIILSIVLFGLVGNAVSFAVLVQLTRQSSFYVYLSALALSDFSYLLLGLALYVFQAYNKPEEGVCTVLGTFCLIASQCSSWITVGVTIDRYIAVCHPFKVAKFCNRKRALMFLVITFLIITALNFPAVCLSWEADICLFPEFAKTFCSHSIPTIDLFFYVIFPLLAIFVFNIMIVRRLYQASKFRRSLADPTSPNTMRLKDSIRKTMVTLFSVTAVFTITLHPIIAHSIYISVSGLDSDGAILIGPGANTVMEIASYINHSVNFILYGLSGAAFRKQLTKMCCWYCRRNK